MEMGFSYTEIKGLSTNEMAMYLALFVVQQERAREVSMARSR